MSKDFYGEICKYLVLIRQKNRFVIVRKKLLRDILDTVIRYVTRYSLCCDVLKGHSGAELHIIFFWSTWKVYTMKYFSIAKLFLIALLRNNYLSPKCIGD